ncbi:MULTISPECIES: hypothetical protein [Trichocoleus]|uniref:Uncharacterized protein n=1 Tax=Trichocoleus desertorum GB2-A4 TaxID=2933944 RepID=A0ABV0JH18_9CYAN|nr:hypothetical protein [Trichocoleus sp. FACHB-46]
MSGKDERAGKLKGIFDAVKTRVPEPDIDVESQPEPEDEQPSAIAPKADAEPKVADDSPKRVKAKGKRSSSDYKQVSAYIPASMHLEVKQKLLREAIAASDAKPKEFSDLVCELLAEWLAR